MNLKKMSIEELYKLSKQVDAEIAKLRGPSKSALLGRQVAPKYRNRKNPSETWAGRGLKPKWLSEAIEGGKKLESFLIR